MVVIPFPDDRDKPSNHTNIPEQEPGNWTNTTPSQLAVTVYLSRLSDTTRRGCRGRLDVMASLFQPGADATTFPWHTLEYSDCAQLRALLLPRYQYRTTNNFLYTLRGLLRECWLLGLMTTEEYHRCKEIGPIKGQSDIAGRYISDEEWSQFFSALARDKTTRGFRDHAIFSVLRSTGMRRGELLRLAIEDYRSSEVSFKVLGKGNKFRTVFADEWILPALNGWLLRRGNMEGALFCAVYKNGHIQEQRRGLSQALLHSMLGSRIHEAGVAHFTLHDFRRNMATDLWDANVSAKAIMDQGGWARVETAMGYDRRPAKRAKDASKNIRNPHRQVD